MFAGEIVKQSFTGGATWEYLKIAESATVDQFLLDPKAVEIMAKLGDDERRLAYRGYAAFTERKTLPSGHKSGARAAILWYYFLLPTYILESTTAKEVAGKEFPTTTERIVRTSTAFKSER